MDSYICAQNNTTSAKDIMENPGIAPDCRQDQTVYVESVSLEMFENNCWPELKRVVSNLLQVERYDQCNKISFQDMYSCVYKCICSRHAERLHYSLLELVSVHLQSVSLMLEPGVTIQSKCQYIGQCLEVLRKYGRALHEIVPIFTYLNRVYITPILNSNLEDQLLNLFKLHVIDKHALTLIGAMKCVRKIPFSVEPAVMAELTQALFSMKPDLRSAEADFFSHYIAHSVVSNKTCRLEDDIEATRRMQHELQQDPNFNLSNSNKRSKDEVEIEDEECSSTLLSTLLLSNSS